MSGFVKRNKAVDTVNPAGGIDPAKTPNVSQYGWTSYDAANVNQIIQYVNMCKDYAEQATNSANYVAGKFVELQAFINYIEEVYAKLKPIADNIEIIYTDITAKHGDISGWYTEIQTIYVDILALERSAKDSAASALVSKTEAEASALNAKVSETNADKSAKDAANIAEELRKGQVYRGAWNLEENNAFPPKPDTNSVWDVTLKEDSIEFVFEGETWYWGDRLLYLKDEDKFSQIESGSTVVSVNGKKGAVTLVAADVGAYDKTETDTKFVPKTTTVNSKPLSSNINLTAGDVGSYTKVEIDNRIYPLVPKTTTVNSKPLSGNITLTAADVGAVNKTGDTMTGNLRIEQGSVFPYVDLPGDASTVKQGLSVSNLGTRPADGSYPTDYSTILNVNGSSMDRQFQLSCNSIGDAFHIRSSHSGAPDPSKWYPWMRIYHTGFKPTAADVGAVSKITLGGCTDYTKAVILLHPISGGASDFHYFDGEITAYRHNGNNPVYTYKIVTQKKYNSTDFQGDAYSFGGKSEEIYLAKCTYEGTTYLALHLYPSSAQVGSIEVRGRWSKTPLKIQYFQTNTGTTLNGEVNSSLVKLKEIRIPYDQLNKPTAVDIDVSNPLTKDKESLADVISEMRKELISLRAEVQILRRGILES